MEKRKVLIVSCTKFYGGGEIFVSRVFPQLEEYYDFFYQVRSKELYEILPSEYKFFVEHEVSFKREIAFARKLIRQYKIDIVVLNGNRSFLA